MIESFDIVADGLSWLVGNGSSVRVGVDLWVGCNEAFTLPRELRESLAAKGIFSLNQISNEGTTTFWNQGWKLVEDLDPKPQWEGVWMDYTMELHRSSVHIRERVDDIQWVYSCSGIYDLKFGYKLQMDQRAGGVRHWWFKPLWKLSCPAKSILFFWCIIRNEVPTWENL